MAHAALAATAEGQQRCGKILCGSQRFYRVHVAWSDQRAVTILPYLRLLREVLAGVWAFLSDPGAQPGTEAVPVPFADGGSQPQTGDRGTETGDNIYLPIRAGRDAWAALPLWPALAAWERALGMVLNTHLQGDSRCARGACFATTAHHGVRMVAARTVSRALLYRVAQVCELLLLWMRPRAQRARNPPQAMFLWHATGWVLTLMLMSWQLLRGTERASLACRRCVGLPGSLVHALRVPDSMRGHEHVLGWLVDQGSVLLDMRRDEACAYTMAGERTAYLGSTSQRSRPGTTGALGLPAMRAGQHLSDVSRSSFKSDLHKVQSMAKEPRGMLVSFVVLTGGARNMRSMRSTRPQHAQHSSFVGIRQARPYGNTSLATRGGWRRMPAEESAARRAARRRPWPQQREQTGPPSGPLECLLRDLPKVVAMGAAREQGAQRSSAPRVPLPGGLCDVPGGCAADGVGPTGHPGGGGPRPSHLVDLRPRQRR